MTLQEFFKEVPKAAVAFSGGADSAFLLWAAREYGADVRAYYVKTAFQPAFELKDARRLARELQVPMTVIEEDILAVPEAAQNGPKRCYYCKRALFSSLREAARRDGYPVLLDGTNASDDAKDRPGMQALRELQVRSPLRECGRSPRNSCGRCLKKPVCLPGRSRPMPAWLPGCPRERRSRWRPLKMWSGRKRFCQNLALRIFGCVSARREQGSR